MADIFDQASDYEAKDREAAISAAAGRATWSGPSPDITDGVGADLGRGVDVGCVVGSAQGDATTQRSSSLRTKHEL